MTVFERGNEILGMILKVVTVFVLLMSLLAYAGSSSLLFETLVNLRLQYMVISVVILVYFMVTRAWVWLALIALSVLVNGLEVVPCYAVSRGAERGAEYKSMTLLVANVGQDNAQYDDFFAKLEYEDPDIVFMQEVNRDWTGQLGKIAGGYPHSFVLTKENRTGLAVMSKWPFYGSDVVELGPAKIPCAVVQVRVLNQTLNLIGAHLTPPLRAERLEARNQELADLAEVVKKSEGLVIVMGGLNASIWAPVMKQFIADTSLMDARKGTGVLATWPSYLPSVRIPIDYCLVGEGISVKSIRLVEPCGSDHMSLMVEIGIAGPEFKMREGRD